MMEILRGALCKVYACLTIKQYIQNQYKIKLKIEIDLIFHIFHIQYILQRLL